MTRASEVLEPGTVYTRAELREQFAVKDATLYTGIFCPAGLKSVWLFVTEVKTPDRTQYRDVLRGDVLEWDGQRLGRKDGLIVRHREFGLEILVFYRRRKYEFEGAGFRYVGLFQYVSHSGARPSHFKLKRVAGAINQKIQQGAEDGAMNSLERAAGAARTGMMTDTDRRRAVERYAMSAAKAYFKGRGYTVRDTSLLRPYDLEIRRANEKLFVEVKGTTAPGEEIMLTQNEVRHARENRSTSILFILGRVQIVGGGTNTARAIGGRTRVVWPWDVDLGELAAITYRYRILGDS